MQLTLMSSVWNPLTFLGVGMTDIWGTATDGKPSNGKID